MYLFVDSPLRLFLYEAFNALKDLPGIDELLYEHKGSASWIHVAWAEQPRHKINLNYEV